MLELQIENEIKNTRLYDVHKSLGAKLIPFAGFNMPVQYEGIIAEHICVRNAVGVFDVSHMGEFIVKGNEALNLLQYVTSNDVSALEIGQVQYSCLPNNSGGIVDDLLVYRLGKDEYLLVVNASNIEKDLTWLKNKNPFNVPISDISDWISLLAVQGPEAIDTLQRLTDFDLSLLEYYHAAKVQLAGYPDILISATGYTGAGGFEIYIPNENVVDIWNKIFEAGKEFGIKPIGLGARDTLRLEMGYCLYGNDINDNTSPLEAGLGWITKFSKNFINSTNLKNQKERGVKVQLVGFEMLEKGIPRHDHVITDKDGNNIGYVTSGTQSPSLQKGIGMGYINKEFSSAGNEIYILIRGKKTKAQVVKLPFLKSNVR